MSLVSGGKEDSAMQSSERDSLGPGIISQTPLDLSILYYGRRGNVFLKYHGVKECHGDPGSVSL